MIPLRLCPAPPAPAQVKLVLAGAMWSQPHLLVLDEVGGAGRA